MLTIVLPRTSTNRFNRPPAFTLIEILASITVVAILVSILILGTQRVRISSQKVVASSNLRQVGVAIQLYAQDNNGYLPGPLWSAQRPYYGISPQANSSSRILGNYIAVYAGLPEPDGTKRDFPLLSSPLFEDMRPSPETPAYLMNNRVNLSSSGEYVNPWGYESASQAQGEGTSPISMIRVVGEVDPSIWAISAIDKGNGNPNAGWTDILLDEPLFPRERLQLYFDWRVEFVPVD